MAFHNPVFDVLVAESKKHGAAAVRSACKRFLTKRAQRGLGVEKERRQPIPRKWVAEAYVRQNGMCPWKNHEMRLIEATGDHVKPLNAGGKHVRGNIQALCGSCNSEKGDRDLLEQSKVTGRTVEQILEVSR